MSGGDFHVAGDIRVVVAEPGGHDLTALARQLCDGLTDYCSATPTTAREQAPASRSIRLGFLNETPLQAELGSPVFDPRMSDEGFVLSVRSDRIIVAGVGIRGCHHGVQSLLRRIDERGRIAHGQWLDWPRFPLRGAHLYVPASRDLDYFERLLAYLASLGMNTIFLEIGAAVRSHRHPRINEAWRRVAQMVHDYPFGQNQFANRHDLHGRGKDSFHGDNGDWGEALSHDEVRRILRCARRHHLEVVPEIQSLSHSYWLCLAYPQIAERSDDPYPCTYCPSNERTYELLFDVTDEWLELFEPRQVHIGHDEWYFRNICPRCRLRSAADLLAEDVGRIKAHLDSRGVGCVMWADQLLDPDALQTPRIKEWGTGRMIQWAGGERHFADEQGAYTTRACHQALAAISPDITLADWYYVISPDTADHLSRQGRRVLLGNFNPFFLDRQRGPLQAGGVRGGFISTWVQASMTAHASDHWFVQAMIAADMLWRRELPDAPLAERMEGYLRQWSRDRDALLPPHARRVRQAPSVEVSLPHGPPTIAAGATQPVVVTFDQPWRALRLVVSFAPDALEGVPPLYDFSRLDDYLRRVEVVRCRLISKLRHGMEAAGWLSLHAGIETGAATTQLGMTAWTRATLADPERQSDGRHAFAWEWTHPAAQRQPVARIELLPGAALVRSAATLHSVWVRP